MKEESLNDYRKRCELLDLSLDATDDEVQKAFHELKQTADRGRTTKLQLARDYLLKNEKPDE